MAWWWCNKGGVLCRTDVNKKRYDTVTFAIGGREFYALVRSLTGNARKLTPCGVLYGC